MEDEIIKKMFKKPEDEPVFQIGQTVRVISYIEVNFPSSMGYWFNAKCKVLKIVPRGFFGRVWCYVLEHPDGHICEFKKEELDLRYRKRKAA